ncbi:hypothetical protein HPP92_002905 [Vanilla planifolia]|uniref:Uncharacterized protein n=1 Tax=Vanilla planifolia TaxID=51239 RepID=A0A835SFL3_VANPL|nr:hypothetical protein HPP92_002905 [Vanilla planifolia]
MWFFNRLRVPLLPLMRKGHYGCVVVPFHLDERRGAAYADTGRVAQPNGPAIERYLTGMGLWTFLEGLLLLANAFAILNEDRFLAPRGWRFSEALGGWVKSLKGQLIELIYATQYLRIPLSGEFLDE